MNGEHPSREKLQQHYDGELGDLNEQAGVDLRQHLRECAHCQGELAALDRLSDMLRWSTDEAAAASDPDFTRMFSEIERAVSQPSNVVPLGQQAGGAPRLVYRIAPALGALALAAAALLMVYRSSTVPADSAPTQLAALDAAHHSEIVAVKFGTNAGQVFGIPMSDGSSVPVVWIDDVDEEE